MHHIIDYLVLSFAAHSDDLLGHSVCCKDVHKMNPVFYFPGITITFFKPTIIHSEGQGASKLNVHFSEE